MPAWYTTDVQQGMNMASMQRAWDLPPHAMPRHAGVPCVHKTCEAKSACVVGHTSSMQDAHTPWGETPSHLSSLTIVLMSHSHVPIDVQADTLLVSPHMPLCVRVDQFEVILHCRAEIQMLLHFVH
jgi:hypothetical protein